jgi:hypothetical protein
MHVIDLAAWVYSASISDDDKLNVHKAAIMVSANIVAVHCSKQSTNENQV